MYIGYQEDLSFWKLLVPVTAGLLAFATGYYVLGPGQMPGGSSGGGGSPISVGTLLLLSTTDPKELLSRVREKIEKRHVVQAGAMLAVKAVVVGSISVFGVGTSLILFGAFLGGAALLPLLTLILGAVGKGENLAELLMMIGLMGFDDPMFDLGADDQYRVVEAEAVGLEGTPRTKFAKSLVGFTCDVSPEAFGHAGHSAADLEDYRPVQLVADGGAASLPRGYVPTEGMTNANHQGFMPADPSPSTTFVRSDTWLGRFRDSATGAAIAVAEQEATKKFAAGDAEISDNRLMKLSAVAAALGIGFWVVIALV